MKHEPVIRIEVGRHGLVEIRSEVSPWVSFGVHPDFARKLAADMIKAADKIDAAPAAKEKE